MTRRTVGIRTAAGAAVLLAIAACIAACGVGGRADPEAWQDRAAWLAPSIEVRNAPGVARAPVGLLLSGCDGPRDNLDRWADMLNAAGWAAAIVDSHTPRGLATDPLWRLVCTGQVLPGQARAADVAAAMALLRAQGQLDMNRVVLIGGSHGGWTALELLAAAAGGRPPDGLTAWPGGSSEAALAGLVGIVALYPYCGTFSTVGDRGWRRPVPVLMLLVAEDSVVGTEPCTQLAARMQARSLPVTTHLYSGVTHAFDQRDRAALSTLEFDPDATADALARGRAFLEGLR